MPHDELRVSPADSPLPLAEAAAIDGGVDLAALPREIADRLGTGVGESVRALRRLTRALLVAIGLSLLACIPTLITHVPTALLAPITAGYTTGGIMRLTGGESLALSLVFLALIGLPLPIAHARFGVLTSLGTPTVVFFAVVAAVYFAVLIGAFAWIGGGGLSDDAA